MMLVPKKGEDRHLEQLDVAVRCPLERGRLLAEEQPYQDAEVRPTRILRENVMALGFWLLALGSRKTFDHILEDLARA